MTTFLIRRGFRSFATLATVVLLVFVGTRLTGDPTDWLLPDDATPEAIESLRRTLGVDKPLIAQLGIYVQQIGAGDFGNSFYDRRPVTTVVMERLPATARLSGFAFLLSLAVGIPVGIIAAVMRNSVLDRALMATSFTAYAIPTFVLGIMLVLIFSLNLRWFPSGGDGGFKYHVLPVITLGSAYTALLARLVRSSMLEVLRQDFVRTAHSKGLTQVKVLWKHTLRNAFLPVLTIIGLSLATLVSGAVITETIFAWPGIGRLVLESVIKRDFPTVQFIVLFITTVVIVINFLIDISYSILDPRIQFGN